MCVSCILYTHFFLLHPTLFFFFSSFSLWFIFFYIFSSEGLSSAPFCLRPSFTHFFLIIPGAASPSSPFLLSSHFWFFFIPPPSPHSETESLHVALLNMFSYSYIYVACVLRVCLSALHSPNWKCTWKNRYKWSFFKYTTGEAYFHFNISRQWVGSFKFAVAPHCVFKQWRTYRGGWGHRGARASLSGSSNFFLKNIILLPAESDNIYSGKIIHLHQNAPVYKQHTFRIDFYWILI